MQRRNFLKLLSMGLPGFYLYGSADHQTKQPPARTTASSKLVRTADPQKYIDRLPIPQRLEPVSKNHGVQEYRVHLRQFKKKLHSQLPETTLWGYEGKYPGPILEAKVNEPVTVEWINELPEQHLFAIDKRLHGAMPPAPAVRTVTHLHGAHTASADDGLPEKWIRPGESATFHYPNQQRATMLWYHDHALGITRLNNYAGLAAIYFLRDVAEEKLNLPSGPYEIPLMLQDRLLSDSGELIYWASSMASPKLPPGVWGPEFFGNVALINGAIFPYLEVEPRRYRFRVVNAANSRFFSIFFSDPSIPFYNVAQSFTQIGNDGGLLPQPVDVSSVVLGPAERADLVVDFSQHAGKTLILANYAPAPFPAGGGDESPMKAEPLRELMQVRIAPSARSVDKMAKPSWSMPVEEPDLAKVATTRDLVLEERLDGAQNSLGVKINGLGYDAETTELPKINSTEIWRFINTTDDTHPMHLHLVQFQVLQRQSFDIQKFLNNKKLEFISKPRQPEKGEAGWKDTARVNPGEVLSLLVPFSGFTGKYVYHCHMLEHEDNDMMRPFEVKP